MAAINLAWQQDADAVEVDVHVTSDEQIVVIHDPDTGRTGDNRKIIADHSLSDLRKIDMGRWKGTQWAGERIPTLEEVFHAVPKHKKIFVEIKGKPTYLFPLITIINKNLISRAQIVLMDFNLQVVLSEKSEFPDIETL